MRAVIDHEVDRTVQVAGDDVEHCSTVRLIDAPTRHDARLERAVGDVPAEVRAVAPLHRVDRDDLLRLEHLVPERGASAVPDSDLEDTPRPERGRRPKAIVLIDELPVLVQRERLAVARRRVRAAPFQLKDHAVEHGTVSVPDQRLEHGTSSRTTTTGVTSR